MAIRDLILDAIEDEIGTGAEWLEAYDVKDAYDTSEWPFQMKVAILEQAHLGWNPDNEQETDGSYWVRGMGINFLKDFSELRNAFARHPGVVAADWTERTQLADARV